MAIDESKMRAVLNRLESEKADLEAQIAELAKQASDLEAQAAGFRVVLAYQEQHPGELEAITPVGRRVGKELDDAIVDVLKQAGKPMHYKDVCKQVELRGIKVPGMNPAANVGAHMSQDERCDSLGDGMWGLMEWRQSKVPQRTETQQPPATPVIPFPDSARASGQ